MVPGEEHSSELSVQLVLKRWSVKPVFSSRFCSGHPVVGICGLGMVWFIQAVHWASIFHCKVNCMDIPCCE